MPVTIENVVYYTQDEVNNAAKSARVEAETTTKAKLDPQISELTTKATLADTLQAQLQTLTSERDTIKGERDGLKKTSALTKALKAKGLTDPVIDLALNHKGVDALDPADATALEAFVAPFAALAAATQTQTPSSAGTGGSPTGDVTIPKTLAEVEALIKGNPAWISDPKNLELANKVMLQ